MRLARPRDAWDEGPRTDRRGLRAGWAGSGSREKKWTKKRVLGTAILTAFVVAFVVVLLLLATGSVKLLVVFSGSMAPAMNPGDVAVVTPIAPEDVKLGDIITFRNPSDPRVVTSHRVVEILEGEVLQFRTQGDTNEAPDIHLVKASDVTGAVSLSIPHLGYLSAWMRHPAFFLSLIVLPAVMLIGLEARNVMGHVGGNVEEIKKHVLKGMLELDDRGLEELFDGMDYREVEAVLVELGLIETGGQLSAVSNAGIFAEG